MSFTFDTNSNAYINVNYFFQEAHNALSPGIFKPCQAVHTYNGDKKSELQFGEGDIILILEEESPRLHWLVGCLDADRSKMGLVSVHFVQFLDKDEDQRLPRPKCIATYDYQSNDVGELNFNKGDVILILDMISKGQNWMMGCLEKNRKKRGLLPLDKISKNSNIYGEV